MGKDERIVLWDNSSGELIPKPSVSISSLPNNSWQIAFNFHFLTKQHQGKQATKSNVCPVICHPNILYILIQFKSFYRFAQGYCGWLKVESREKLLDVGTHKICTQHITQDFADLCYINVARCILHTNKTYLNRHLHSFSFVEKLYRDTNIAHDNMYLRRMWWCTTVRLFYQFIVSQLLQCIVVSTTPPPTDPTDWYTMLLCLAALLLVLICYNTKELKCILYVFDFIGHFSLSGFLQNKYGLLIANLCYN